MSTAVSLFELASEIARSHERTPSGQITVIPVIVDSLHAARPVLRALSDVMEGRYLDTSSSDMHTGMFDSNEPVAGTEDPVRREAVKSTLRTEEGRRIALIDEPGGLLDATLENPSAGVEPSPGDRTITAIAKAAVHRDLDQFEFIIISYQSGVLDLPFRKAAWGLMVDQFASMPNATLRTLVVVVEAAIDIDLHCQSGRGFRFAIEGARLLRRQGRNNLLSAVSQIASREPPIVFFLGAGFSASSHMPFGNAVRDGAIRRLLGNSNLESLASAELAARFHEWVAEKPGWLTPSEQLMSQHEFVAGLTLERVLDAEKRLYPSLPTLTEFKALHDRVVGAPGPSVLALASVLQQNPGRVIVVEVNFDLLVETHAGVATKVFASTADFSEAPDYLGRYIRGEEQDVPVLKLHGTIKDFDTCIVTHEQTEPGVGIEKLGALRALLGQGNRARLWIYVGASMRDRDLLRALTGEEFGRGLDERWVLPYVVESVEEYAASRSVYWNDTDLPRMEDRIITESSDAFFAALAEEWIDS
jgi:hypothetical protein